MDETSTLLRLIHQLCMAMHERTNKAMAWVCMVEQCLNAITYDNKRLYTLLQQSRYGPKEDSNVVLPPPVADPTVLHKQNMTVDCPVFGPQPRSFDLDWFVKGQQRFEYETQPDLPYADRVTVEKFDRVTSDPIVMPPFPARVGGSGAGAAKRARQDPPPPPHLPASRLAGLLGSQPLVTVPSVPLARTPKLVGDETPVDTRMHTDRRVYTSICTQVQANLLQERVDGRRRVQYRSHHLILFATKFSRTTLTK